MPGLFGRGECIASLIVPLDMLPLPFPPALVAGIRGIPSPPPSSKLVQMVGHLAEILPVRHTQHGARHTVLKCVFVCMVVVVLVNSSHDARVCFTWVGPNACVAADWSSIASQNIQQTQRSQWCDVIGLRSRRGPIRERPSRVRGRGRMAHDQRMNK